MPYANITLTCQTCGEEFDHRRKCYNSREVNSYIDWAKDHITECPECRAKAKREAEAAKMHSESIVFRVSYKDYKNDFGAVRSVPNSYDASTKTVEIAIDDYRAKNIVRLAKSDEDLTNILIANKKYTREEAAEAVSRYRDNANTLMCDSIGSGWKKLITEYIDQFPAEEETEEAPVETEEPEEEPIPEETPVSQTVAVLCEPAATEPTATEPQTEPAPEEPTQESTPEEPAEMTIIERIKKAVDNLDCETDNIDKLIALAYYIGREDATREISDQYNAVLAEQRERADNSRYHKLAHEIIGDIRYIYSGDYAKAMKATFGSDKTKL